MDLFETVRLEKYLVYQRKDIDYMSKFLMMFVLVREIKINSEGI